MKKVGLICGVDYGVTLKYCKDIDRQVNEWTGGYTTADLVLRKLNLGEYYNLAARDDWKAISNRILSEIFSLINDSKCDYVTITTDTMSAIVRMMTDQIGATHTIGIYSAIKEAGIPFIHVGNCVVETCKEAGLEKVALLGTRSVALDNYLMKLLFERNGMEVISVYDDGRIDHIVEETREGNLMSYSRRQFYDLCKSLIYKIKVEVIVFNGDEIQWLIGTLPDWMLTRTKVLNVTQIHIDELVDLCLLK